MGLDNDPTLVGELDGIADEVAEHLAQPDLVVPVALLGADPAVSGASPLPRASSANRAAISLSRSSGEKAVRSSSSLPASTLLRQHSRTICNDR